jgi:transposase
LKAWGLKLMRKKGIKKASVAVGRKLAVLMHRMLIDEKEFIYEEQHQNIKAA